MNFLIAVGAGSVGRDLTLSLQLALQKRGSIGQTFNLATIYQEWRDIAQM